MLPNIYFLVDQHLKTFKATFYSSSQLIIFVNDEQKVASNGIILGKFQPIGVNSYWKTQSEFSDRFQQDRIYWTSYRVSRFQNKARGDCNTKQ